MAYAGNTQAQGRKMRIRAKPGPLLLKGAEGGAIARGSGASKDKRKRVRVPVVDSVRDVEPPGCTPEEYVRAYTAYKAHPTIKTVAVALGWSTTRARRLVLDGYPDWGMAPLLERFAGLVEEVTADADESDRDVMAKIAREARELRLETLRLLRDGLSAAKAAIFNSKGEVRPKDLRDLYEIYDKLVRLTSFAQGGPDQRGELSIPEGKLDTSAMLANLMAAGILDEAPPRLLEAELAGDDT